MKRSGSSRTLVGKRSPLL